MVLSFLSLAEFPLFVSIANVKEPKHTDSSLGRMESMVVTFHCPFTASFSTYHRTPNIMSAILLQDKYFFILLLHTRVTVRLNRTISVGPSIIPKCLA